MKESETRAQIKQGSETAFEMLFNDYYVPLVNYSNTLVRDKEDAEDIVQQVYISVWQKRTEIDKIDSLRNYLYRAVHNSSLNRIKQRTVRSDYAKEQMYVITNRQETSIIQKELQQKIEKSIEKLPEQCAKVFKMSRFEELKYQEIALALNISVKTVENHMGKALKLMREMLKEYLPVVLIILYNLG